jgi:uncharacterized membrane protein YdbT with pleckstrin-like domain
MPVPWLDLLEDEEIIWRDHPSKWMLLPSIILAVLVIGGYLGLLAVGIIPGDLTQQVITGGIALIGGVLPVSLTELKRRNTEYLITDQRVAKKTRIIARTGDPIRSEKIQNIQYDQGIIDRLLSVGEVEIMTSGRGDVDMRWTRVRNPKAVTDEISARKAESL